MKNIIVFGATGGTGKQVVAQALQAEHSVTVVVRDPAAITLRHKTWKSLKEMCLSPQPLHMPSKKKMPLFPASVFGKEHPQLFILKG